MFHIWLQNYIKKHDIKRSKLCKIAGYHSNVIHWWLNGRNLPSGYSLAVLATALAKETSQKRAEILDEMATAILKSG